MASSDLTMEQFYMRYSDQFPPFPDLTFSFREAIIQQANDKLRQSTVVVSSTDQAEILHALACLRVLSRDKEHLGSLTSPETVALLLKHAELCHTAGEFSTETTDSTHASSRSVLVDPQVAIESEKVLHNLLIQSAEVRVELSHLECIASLIARLRCARDDGGDKDTRLPYDIIFFDLRILFLITALTPSTRAILRYDLDAALVVYDLLHVYLDRGILVGAEQQTTFAERTLSDRDADLLIEISKLMYNMTITLERFTPSDEETAIAVTLVKTTRKMLQTQAVSEEKTFKLRTQAVNLLTSVPRSSYRFLVMPLAKREADASSNSAGEAAGFVAHESAADNAGEALAVNLIVGQKKPDVDVELSSSLSHASQNYYKDDAGGDSPTTFPADVPHCSPAYSSDSNRRVIAFMGYDMTPVVILISILQTCLERCTRYSSQVHTQETMVPILTCLCEAARATRIIRKFLKLEILPPLNREALKQRPEIGSAVRNKLCSLMTSPVTEVKMLAAEFLFILCKESVDRLVRYTGYGNAAGLLAGRGLMAPQKAAEQEARSASIYSDDDDSDTEAFDDLRDKINPILGCVEDEPRFDPMAGMTEEQKEFEAMKLVDILDKMARRGVVQPMCIGSDGKPRPVEHVFELRDAASAARTSSRAAESSASTRKHGETDEDSANDVE